MGAGERNRTAVSSLGSLHNNHYTTPAYLPYYKQKGRCSSINQSFMLKKISLLLILVAVLNFSWPLLPALGQSVDVNPSASTQWASGVDQSAVLESFKIIAPAKALKAKTSIKLDNLGSTFEWPWNYEPLSPVYQFDFSDKGASYDRVQPLHLEIAYGASNNYYKQIFFYDSGQKKWRALPSTDDPVKKVVTADIHLPYARVAVLYNDQILTVGQASWYRHKGGLFAASPDFKAGTILRVTNLENGKAVTVVVNDYGPDRKLHPNRVVDLDAVAFAKIASTKSGLIKVKIETQKLISISDQEKINPSGSLPSLSSRSAVIFSEKDGSILFNKNASTTAPLASLTKLIAAQVFLETKPTLSEEVAYSVKDENYNYQYCKPWESARLRVAEGETMTIENLLYAALVGSANNAVETLVRVSGLSRPDFIQKMNETVKAWGAQHTNFIEPTGLSPENVSSPLDYAIITRELYKNPLLKKISTTAKYSFTTINKKIKHNLSNTNGLILSGNYKINGSKTGYLDEAGYCLMTRVESPSGNLIIVNFGAKSKDDNFKDNEQLIRYGLKQLAQ